MQVNPFFFKEKQHAGRRTMVRQELIEDGSIALRTTKGFSVSPNKDQDCSYNRNS
jgi:hypothetical protein